VREARLEHAPDEVREPQLVRQKSLIIPNGPYCYARDTAGAVNRRRRMIGNEAEYDGIGDASACRWTSSPREQAGQTTRCQVT
jgi:hypothetical protein